MPIARISGLTSKILHQLAKQRNETMQEILESAVELYRRRCILEETNMAFARMKGLKSEKKERELWDISIGDGLKGD